MICSSMGCIRDDILIDHLVTNILHFHQLTAAPVDIKCYNHCWSSIILQNGLNYQEFITDLKRTYLTKFLQTTSLIEVTKVQIQQGFDVSLDSLELNKIESTKFLGLILD